MRSDFAVFILTHGRPNNIKTLKTLKDGNYSGTVYIVIDNEDKTADEYYRLYGEQVIMFDKLEISKRFDTADNFIDRRSVVYARNACFDIAEEKGIRYFLELDDDYERFNFRTITPDGHLKATRCKQLDRLFECMVDFLETTGALTVAFSQGGDLIGGAGNNNFHKGLIRKAMNTFFCKTANRFNFVGRVNEDVNTYTSLGSRGQLLFTVMQASINQTVTQKSKGGMTELYLESGTYVKSFYSVIFCPSAVTVAAMPSKHSRIHHSIEWNNCVPCIINQKYKK